MRLAEIDSATAEGVHPADGELECAPGGDR